MLNIHLVYKDCCSINKEYIWDYTMEMNTYNGNHDSRMEVVMEVVKNYNCNEWPYGLP